MNAQIDAAVEVLKRGGIILYPTDTVWGIGCDATNEEAVEKVFKLKQRSDSKSLITLAANADMVCRYVEQMPDIAISLIEVNDKPMTIIYPGAMGLAKNDANLKVAKMENDVISLEADASQYKGMSANDNEAIILHKLQQGVFCDNSLTFASMVQSQFKNEVGRKDRSVHQAPFLVLWKTAMPSVLIETGFITNDEEEKWLNQTDNGCEFFLLELHLIRIGTSPLAPLFSVKSAPAKDSREKGDIRREETKRHELRLKFWTKFLEAVKQDKNMPAFRKTSATKDSFISSGTGIGGILWTLWITRNFMRCELRIDRGKGAADENLAILHKLSEDRESVDKAFGPGLKWEEMDGYRVRTVVLDGFALHEDGTDVPSLCGFDIQHHVLVELHREVPFGGHGTLSLVGDGDVTVRKGHYTPSDEEQQNHRCDDVSLVPHHSDPSGFLRLRTMLTTSYAIRMMQGIRTSETFPSHVERKTTS